MIGRPTGIRVLVTGGSGFVGRGCVRVLAARGAEVHATSRSIEVDRTPGVTWHRVDLRDAAAAIELVDRVRPSHLLHLAWETTHGQFWDSPENMHWLSSSVELFRAFADFGGSRAVIAGTCAEYRSGEELCNELSTPLEPTTLYGACKHALHVAVNAYAKLSDVSLAWGRIFFLFGPGENPARLIPSVVIPLIKGEPARCSHGRQVRDFLYVEEAADAFVALLTSEITGAVNIASGEAITIGEVATMLGRLTGSPEFLRIGATPARPDEPASLVADVTRLRDEVRWHPQHDLESGLRKTVSWWAESLKQ